MKCFKVSYSNFQNQYECILYTILSMNIYFFKFSILNVYFYALIVTRYLLKLSKFMLR